MRTSTEVLKQPITSEYQQRSQFTLLVYFRKEYAVNGSDKGRKLHSWKYENVTKQGDIVTDHKFAFDRLVKCVLNDFHNKYTTAIIYHNPTNVQVLRFAYNTIRLHREVVFTNDKTGLGSVFHAIK